MQMFGEKLYHVLKSLTSKISVSFFLAETMIVLSNCFQIALIYRYTWNAIPYGITFNQAKKYFHFLMKCTLVPLFAVTNLALYQQTFLIQYIHTTVPNNAKFQ